MSRYSSTVEDLIKENGLPKPRLLETFTWPKVGEAASDSNAVLILPIGATEQHGPQLPINTDTEIARCLCLYASSLSGAYVAPAIPYTVSTGHTTKWPGTFSLSHETFIQSMAEWTAWAASMGWKRILWINSHFGNDASLRVALDKARVKHLGKLQIGLVTTFQMNSEVWKDFSSDAADLHANKAETDLIQFLYPETVDTERLEDDPDRTAGAVFSYPVAQTSLNGLTGAPSQASAAEGRKLFLKMAKGLAVMIEKAKTEQPPLSSEHWSELPELIL